MHMFAASSDRLKWSLDVLVAGIPWLSMIFCLKVKRRYETCHYLERLCDIDHGSRPNIYQIIAMK